MRARPERVDDEAIRQAVGEGWGLRVGELRYCPVGAGAYHWTTHGDDGAHWFVTCDDLDTKPWLGADRDTVFDNLLGAYATAVALRAAGRAFVVAPVPNSSGAPATRIDDRHTLAIFEHAAGAPGEWGRTVAPATRLELVEMLALLHRTTPPAAGLLSPGIEVPGRHALEEALRDLDRPWDGGPLSELARRELAEHADLVHAMLAELDQLADGIGNTDARRVVTHGEPHPGNLIHAGTGLVLVDWDTVAVAPPERDLWMIAADESAVATYRDLTGVTLRPDALAAYRLLWALADVAAYTAQLRAQHDRDADAEHALTAVRGILMGTEPAPYGT